MVIISAQEAREKLEDLKNKDTIDNFEKNYSELICKIHYAINRAINDQSDYIRINMEHWQKKESEFLELYLKTKKYAVKRHIGEDSTIFLDIWW